MNRLGDSVGIAQHFEEAQRVAAIGSFEYRPLEGIHVWSDEMYRLFGMRPGGKRVLLGELFYGRVAPVDQEAARELGRVIAAGGRFAQDLRIIRFDGVERILHIRGRSRISESGELERMIGTTQDVTETRTNERRLRESERRLLEAQRVAGVGSFDGSRDLDEFEWSQELYRIYGLDPEQPKWTVQELMARMRPDAARDTVDWPVPGPFDFEHEMERADGVMRCYEVRGEVYEQDGATRMRGTVRDVTVARRAEAQTTALARMSQLGIQGASLDELLTSVSEEVLAALGADSVSVVVQVAQGRIEAAAGSGRPDLARSRVGAPIGTRDPPFGSLDAGSISADFFTPEDAGFVRSVANGVGLVVERLVREEEIAALADLRGTLVAQTVDAEEKVRREVSEAIHDGPLQDLLAARQDLVEAYEREGTAELVQRAQRGIERAVEQLRAAVQSLHPIVLQHGGLEAALEAAADHAARSGRFTARVAVDEQAAGRRDELVLSLARELLTNAAKHAGATQVTVTVTGSADEVVLEVSDDGCGIAEGRLAAAPREGHIGLASLSERIQAVGGRLEITTDPSAGTTVRAALPAA